MSRRALIALAALAALALFAGTVWRLTLDTIAATSHRHSRF